MFKCQAPYCGYEIEEATVLSNPLDFAGAEGYICPECCSPLKMDPPLAERVCGTCEFWTLQRGISKGICRLATLNEAPKIQILANDPVAMVLTSPDFGCNQWELD